MACRCTEKGMCERDLVRLGKARADMGQASGRDNNMNNNLNNGKAIVPASYISETEGELCSAVDESHNEVSGKIAGTNAEISNAMQRVQEKYEAYCIEDDAFHAE